MQDPVNRGDYYIIQLSKKDGTPYTSPVKLESVTNTLRSLDSAEDTVSEITPNTDGKIQMYTSGGEYYFASSPSNAYVSDKFTVDSATDHDPNQPLLLNFAGGDFSGNVNWYKGNNHGGEENVVVSLYDADKCRTNYSTMTEADGSYLISNVDIGSYYVGFSNIPHEYVFVVNNQSSVMETGITKAAYDISEENISEVVNADIALNTGSKGTQGPPGAPGINGVNYFPSSSVNMLKIDRQIVAKGLPLVLGDVVEGNGNELLKHGFSYLWNDGILYGFALIRNNGYSGRNEIQLINTGSEDMSIDNLEITIFRAS